MIRLTAAGKKNPPAKKNDEKIKKKVPVPIPIQEVVLLGAATGDWTLEWDGGANSLELDRVGVSTRRAGK